MLFKHLKFWVCLAVLFTWTGVAQVAEAQPAWHKRCAGTGFIPCHVCHGEAGKDAAMHCDECRDTGKLKCRRCNGSGILMSFIQIQKA